MRFLYFRVPGFYGSCHSVTNSTLTLGVFRGAGQYYEALLAFAPAGILFSARSIT